jgi:PGF-pre-PGF domain-containing protein
MKNNMQIAYITALFLAFVFAISTAHAIHSVDVSATPYWTGSNLSSYKITFKVQNLGTSNNSVNAIQIDDLPDQPYLISGANCPSGWSSSIADMNSDNVTDTIICSNSNLGINPGKYINIVIIVDVPSIAADTVAQYGWDYQTNDTTNFTKTGSVNTAVDNAQPSTAVLKSPLNNTINDGTDIVFNWSASSDIGSGISNYVLAVSNSTDFSKLLLNKTINTTFYKSTSILPEGTIFWQVYAVDNVNNTSPLSEQFMFNVDCTAPTIGEVTVNDSYINLSNSVEITAENIADSMNVSSVLVEIHTPNGTVFNKTMEDIGGGDYSYTYKMNYPGTYSIYVIANDSVGNLNKTTNATIVNCVGEATNVKFWKEIDPNTVVILNKLSVSGINEIDVRVTSVMKDVTVAAKEYDKKPSGTVNFQGNVYTYFEINATNLPDSKLDVGTVKFSVPISWINGNNINISDISLYRYTGGAWQKLKTVKTDETASEASFSAETPGFSYFAIGNYIVQQQNQTQPANQTTNQTANQTINNGTQVNNETTNNTTGQTQQQIKVDWDIALAILLVIFVAAFLVYYFIFRKKSVI